MAKDKAYMGISLGSRSFSKEYLEMVLSYCSQRYKEVLFIIADDPHVYTFMATKSLTLENARAKVKEISCDKHKLLHRVAKKNISPNLIIDIKRWGEIAHRHEYQDVLLSLHKLESVNILFHNDLMQSFARHLDVTNQSELTYDKRFIGSRYVIEELSMMLYLQEVEGYSVQISPEEKPEYLTKFYKQEYRQGMEYFNKKKLEEVDHIVISPTQ